MYKDNYGAVSQSIDGCILEYSLFSFVTILLMNDENYLPSWRDLAMGTLAGILMCFGRTLIGIAVIEGIAAPAQSLNSTHATW
jgi:hypothetical protein